MANAPEPKLLRPSRTYDISLFINNESYTNDISDISIASSLATNYQIVVLTILITPQTIILNKIYGQDKIKLSIKRLDMTDGVVLNSIDLDLMILNTEFEIPVSDMITTGNQMDRTSFDLVTVTRKPFQTMSSMVSAVFGPTPQKNVYTTPQTIKSIVETMIDQQVPTNPKIEYDTEYQNPDQIFQTCIPPTTLSDAIKYLDGNYGLYNGVLAFFCQYDNTIQIMNLSTKIKKSFDLYIEHLNHQTKEKDLDTSRKGINYFYTYDNLYNNYTGNSRFGVLGQNLKHVVLPCDDLYHVISQNLTDVCTSYGIVPQTKGNVNYINTSVTERTKYYIENNGYDTSEVFANAKISKQIADTSRLSLNVFRSLAVEELLKVGSVVKLATKTQEHIDISGKYILFSSDIRWSKASDWETSSTLELIRTNNTI